VLLRGVHGRPRLILHRVVVQVVAAQRLVASHRLNLRALHLASDPSGVQEHGVLFVADLRSDLEALLLASLDVPLMIEEDSHGRRLLVTVDLFITD